MSHLEDGMSVVFTGSSRGSEGALGGKEMMFVCVKYVIKSYYMCH